MTPTAVALLLIAAIAHASWNLMSKHRSPSAAFFLVTSFAGMLCLSPILLLYAPVLTSIPRNVWLLLLMTGACQSLYFIGLAQAYRLGHFSLAYPLVRAAPVLLIAAVNLLVGRGRQIGTIALIGMAIIGVGCLLLPMKRFHDLRLKNYLHASSLMALFAAAGTCGYTIIDDEALRQLREYPPTAIGSFQISTLYLLLEMSSTGMFVLLYVAWNRTERDQWRAFDWPALASGFIAGALIVIAYGLLLVSLAYVSNVSYASAFRQVSIPLGVALGVVLLKEPCPAPKIVGVAMLLTGLIMVGFG
jgi:drug/metabolite transporter (DMT)-like permease